MLTDPAALEVRYGHVRMSLGPAHDPISHPDNFIVLRRLSQHAATVHYDNDVMRVMDPSTKDYSTVAPLLQLHLGHPDYYEDVGPNYDNVGPESTHIRAASLCMSCCHMRGQVDMPHELPASIPGIQTYALTTQLSIGSASASALPPQPRAAPASVQSPIHVRVST